MAAPLILRIITDASQTLRANQSVIASNTLVGKSALDMGADFAVAAKSAVRTAVAMEEAIGKEAAAYRALSTSASLSAREQVKAAQLAEVADARLARSQGLVVTSMRGTSTGAKTAERDLGKLTRGALAGSGVISALGRSLAFASGGFIAVAGTATLLHNAIADALSYAATQKQVEAQLKTGGLSFETYRGQIEGALTAESKLSGFTRQDLLQSFGYLVRVSGNVQQSLNLNAVAADVARGRHIALSSASLALAKALGGSSTALRRLGIIVPQSAKGMAAIEYVARKFAGQAEAGATSADHLHASLATASETIGTAVLPTFNRLVGEFTDWISKMEQSGRLERDANEAFTTTGYIFHTLEKAIKAVDSATGGFTHTLALLVALELGSKMTAWITSLRIMATEWGLVGAAATKAGAEQAAALSLGGAAGGSAAGAAAGEGALTGLFAGGALGRLGRTGIGAKLFGGRAAFAGSRFAVGSGGVATDLAAGGAVGLSATAVGGLAVASVLATAALTDLAKTVGDKLGAGSTYDKSLGALEGFLTAGFAGNAKFSGLHALGSIVHGHMPFMGALKSTFGPAPVPPFETNQQFQQAGLPVGLTAKQIFGKPPSQLPFSGAKILTQYWKTFTLTYREQVLQAQAALTQSTADDVAEAQKEVARIKTLINNQQITGPALLQAYALEIQAAGVIQSAQQAAAQKRVADAEAAKQKILTDLQNAIDPIKLEVALSKAQSLGQSTIPELKALLGAAYKGLAKAIASGQDDLVKQAYDQIGSLKQSLKDAREQGQQQFTEPMKLQIQLARAQAFGGDTTGVLKQMKKAALAALHSGKYLGQSLVDLLNEIKNINDQLTNVNGTAKTEYARSNIHSLTSGITDPALRKVIEARLSTQGYGSAPHTGYNTSTRSGGDIVVHTTFKLDGRVVAVNTTRHQQKQRRANPPQKRGPHADA